MSDKARLLTTVRLKLPTNRQLPPDKDLRRDLSVVEPVGDTLFVASDETATIERLHRQGDNLDYAGHDPQRLSQFFELPHPTIEDAVQDGHLDEAEAESTKRSEVDIEGLSYDDTTGYLWLTGSHSLARRKPSKKADDVENLQRLTEVRCDPNRYLLGRIPCVREAGRDDAAPRYTLQREVEEPDGTTREAAALKMDRHGGNKLTEALREDVHLARFLDIPAKDNGFDIEGIAARGDRVWLGLRGPVLRGWACLLELRVKPGKPGRLKLQPIGPNDEPYRKHFVDLDGLGIRDLKLRNNDLLILAGPTMDLDGPVTLWCWPNAAVTEHQEVVPRTELRRLLQLPYGIGFDHAEGIALFDHHGRPGLLVAYDNPGDARLHDDAGVDLDLFELPDTAG